MTPYYERDGITLYHADCRELLATLEPGSVDSVISDPPYGNDDTHKGHLANVILKNGEPARQVLGFGGITVGEAVDLAKIWCSVARRWVVFTSEWKFLVAIDAAGLLVRFGIWRKPDGAPQFTGDRPGTGWEAVAICHRQGKKRWNGGGKHAFWNYPKGQNNTGHPTGKPLGLFEEFITDFTDQSDTILDPFAGSCTTGVAAWNLGRKAILCEISEEYCEIGAKRLDRVISQGRLFKPKELAATQQTLFTDAT